MISLRVKPFILVAIFSSNHIKRKYELVNLNFAINSTTLFSGLRITATQYPCFEAKLSEMGTEVIKIKDLEPIVDDAINTLTKIDVIYWNSEPELQRKIIGLIYPEKFAFEDLKELTAKVSEPFEINYMINKKLV